MRKILLLSVLLLISCVQKQQSHPPVGGFFSQKDLETSKNRAKNLNRTERLQIEDWIKSQNQNFYPMPMNYWVDIEDLEKNRRKADGETISYSYEIFDFDLVKLSAEPVKKTKVQFGRFEELKAVEDVLRYLNSGDTATLLVPSILAFGTYGDNKNIPNDLPLIIKINVL